MQMNYAGMYLMSQASGTSMNPQSFRMPMWMPVAGSWTLMLMGQGFLVDTQQSGPRGADKLYSTNWLMFAAQHSAGRGVVQFQTMLSLEPATIADRRYPELFQTGETAYGQPLVDGQHPHNFVMSLAFQYVRPVGTSIFQLYLAPVGDPALGPVAFPHRASAAELPQAPLGHHWQDSTHIASDVVTAAFQHRWLRLEASGFHGAEPGENRWTIPQGRIDSWSGRLSFIPDKNWVIQVSTGRLSNPEALTPGDVERTTASIAYSRPLQGAPAGRAWSSSIIWGRNHEVATGRNLNSWLVETVRPIGGRDFVTGRAEWVDKDELFADDPALEASLDRTAGAVFRIAAYTAGYTHDVGNLWSALETGIGANVTAYRVPAAIQPYYGGHPVALSAYLRVRIKPQR
jgi:hypothetical protein